MANHWSCDKCGWRAVTSSVAASDLSRTCTKPSSLREKKEDGFSELGRATQ